MDFLKEACMEVAPSVAILASVKRRPSGTAGDLLTRPAMALKGANKAEVVLVLAALKNGWMDVVDDIAKTMGVPAQSLHNEINKQINLMPTATRQQLDPPPQ